MSSMSAASSHADAPAAPLIPWLPIPSNPPDGQPASGNGAAGTGWEAAVQRVPYLRDLEDGGTTLTIYRPPTVVQLSEATGFSVSELGGAYVDLPVITLNKIVSRTEQEAAAATAAAAAALSVYSDGFEYLQLAPTDDTLEIAAKALQARRPVPDAEEIFWEAEYWEVLRRVKRQAQEEKQRRRERRLAQRERRTLLGASTSSVSATSPNTAAVAVLQSTATSPLHATPHSRQGSLGGHYGDSSGGAGTGGDRSPAGLHMETAAQRTAKGLLRRARFNETHNGSARLLVRSASLVSQGSASQSTIRCRARPRRDSMSSQYTLLGARGFQYPISSVVSEDGRSAMSDSLRTPSMRPRQSREHVGISLDLELSASGGPTATSAQSALHSPDGHRPMRGSAFSGVPLHTVNREVNSSAASAKEGPHAPMEPGMRSSATVKQPGNNNGDDDHNAAAAAMTTVSTPSSPVERRPRDASGGVGHTSFTPSQSTPPSSWDTRRDGLLPTPIVTPTLSPLAVAAGLQQAPPSPMHRGSDPLSTASSPFPQPRPILSLPPPTPAVTTDAPVVRKPLKKIPAKPDSTDPDSSSASGGGSGPAVPLPAAQPPLPERPKMPPLSKARRRTASRASAGEAATAADTHPTSRCTTARPGQGRGSTRASTPMARTKSSDVAPSSSAPSASRASAAEGAQVATAVAAAAVSAPDPPELIGVVTRAMPRSRGMSAAGRSVKSASVTQPEHGAAAAAPCPVPPPSPAVPPVAAETSRRSTSPPPGTAATATTTIVSSASACPSASPAPSSNAETALSPATPQPLAPTPAPARAGTKPTRAMLPPPPPQQHLQQHKGPLTLPPLHVSPTRDATRTVSTPSESLTPRGTAATVPPSLTPTREPSMTPRLECTAIAVQACAPLSPEDGEMNVSAKSSTVVQSQPPLARLPSPAALVGTTRPALAAPEEPVSHEPVMTNTGESGLRGEMPTPTSSPRAKPSDVGGTPLKHDVAVTTEQRANTQPSAAPSTPHTARASPVTQSEHAAPVVIKSNVAPAVTASRQQKAPVPKKKEASSCCTVM